MIEGRMDRPERNHLLRGLREDLDAATALYYWYGSGNAFDTVLTDSPAFDTEVINSSPQTCANIFFKSAVADTPTPFTLMGGDIIQNHYIAKVNSIVGVRRINLYTQLFYVDADGVSNPVQIGNDSEPTDTLIDSEVEYNGHIHIPANVTIPLGKRLWLKFIATTVSGIPNVTLSVEYDDPVDQIIIPICRVCAP